MRFLFIILISSILIGCSKGDGYEYVGDCDYRAICGVVPSEDFDCEIMTSTFARFSFSSNHDDVLSWVYGWPAVSSNFENIHKTEFLALHYGYLEESGQILYTGKHLSYWFNGKGKLYYARCRVAKSTDSKYKCTIEISFLDDLN